MTSSEYNNETPGNLPFAGASGEQLYGMPPTHFPPLQPEQREQRMGEAIFGAGYAGPPQAPVDRYAVTTGWSSPYEDFTVPSGQKCLLKKLDLGDLVSAGLLEQFDSLGGIVDNELIRPAEGQPPIDVRKAMSDPKQMKALLPVLDKVLKVVVVKPQLQDPPANGEQRMSGVAYVDAVSLVDKIAIFNHAAGDLDDLKSIRPESS